MGRERQSNTLKIVLIVLILVAALVAAYFILTYRPSSQTLTQAPTEQTESTAPIRLVTWNLYNFGRSKDDNEMAVIAAQIRDYDIVAIQEVSTRQSGVQAVARLDDLLDRTGVQWDYIVSEPTKGAGPERYAYLWKPSRLRLVGRGWLERSLDDEIDREPFLARFETYDGTRQMLLANFHAVPTSKKPANEVRLLNRIHALYPDDHVLIMGDFNLSQRHQAFNQLKMAGYEPVLVGQKTSIKMKVKDGERLASEYDNIFFETDVLDANRAGVIDFTDQFRTLKEARRISDHLPVYMEIIWR